MHRVVTTEVECRKRYIQEGISTWAKQHGLIRTHHSFHCNRVGSAKETHCQYSRIEDLAMFTKPLEWWWQKAKEFFIFYIWYDALCYENFPKGQICQKLGHAHFVFDNSFPHNTWCRQKNSSQPIPNYRECQSNCPTKPKVRFFYLLSTKHFLWKSVVHKCVALLTV